MLEREGEAVADDLQTGRVLAVLGARHALDAHRAHAQVEPLGALGVGAGGSRELDRLAVAAAEPPLVGDRESLDRGVGRAADRPTNAIAAASRAAVAASWSPRSSCTAASCRCASATWAIVAGAGDQLAPGARRLGELAGKLACRSRSAPARRPGRRRRRRPASARARAARPRRRRGRRGRPPTRRPRAAARRGRARRRGRRASAGRPRGRALRGAPRPPPARGAASGAPSTAGRRRSPRARAPSRMSRCRPSSRTSRVSSSSVSAPSPAISATSAQVERRARDGRHLDRAAGAVAELGDADHHGVADRVRQRHLAPAGQLQARRALAQRAAHAQRDGELAREERHALGAVVDRTHEVGLRGEREHAGDELARLGEPERRQQDLLEPARAAQVVAQAAQAVAARQPVGAVAADDQQPARGDRLRERRQHLQRGLVGPLQVVEQHERVAEARERAAQRLEQRRAVGLRGRLAELGQQPREMGAQRPAGVQALRVRAQMRAQGGDERPVRRRAALRGGAAQDGRVRAPGQLGGQPGLAGTGLAGEQHDRAAAVARGAQQRLEPLELRPPADQLARHRASLRAARAAVGEIRHVSTASTAMPRMAGGAGARSVDSVPQPLLKE